MTIYQQIAELERAWARLRRTYPGAFASMFPGSTTMAARFAWEVRLAGGVNALEKAIAKIKAAAAEADPHELAEGGEHAE